MESGETKAPSPGNSDSTQKLTIGGHEISGFALATLYVIVSLGIFFFLYSNEGGLHAPVGILGSWATVILAKISFLVNPLIPKEHSRFTIVVASLGCVVFIVIFLLYPLFLSKLTKTLVRISLAAGLLIPPLFHALGSFVALKWMASINREATFLHGTLSSGEVVPWKLGLSYVSIALSIIVVLLFLYLNFRIAIASKKSRAS